MLKTPQGTGMLRYIVTLLGLHLLGACAPDLTPPPNRSFQGLPLSGSLAYAKTAGFTACMKDSMSMRCRRSGVMVEGHGPYDAAVDLVGSDGSGGFDRLTLWHDRDQMAVQDVGYTLVRKGWQSCMTGEGNRGDQLIYTNPMVPLTFSMDISYWGKRRLRIIPGPRKKDACLKPL